MRRLFTMACTVVLALLVLQAPAQASLRDALEPGKPQKGQVTDLSELQREREREEAESGMEKNPVQPFPRPSKNPVQPFPQPSKNPVQPFPQPSPAEPSPDPEPTATQQSQGGEVEPTPEPTAQPTELESEPEPDPTESATEQATVEEGADEPDDDLSESDSSGTGANDGEAGPSGSAGVAFMSMWTPFDWVKLILATVMLVGGVLLALMMRKTRNQRREGGHAVT